MWEIEPMWANVPNRGIQIKFVRTLLLHATNHLRGFVSFNLFYAFPQSIKIMKSKNCRDGWNLSAAEATTFFQMHYTFFIWRVIVSCAQRDEGLADRIYLFISFPVFASFRFQYFPSLFILFPSCNLFEKKLYFMTSGFISHLFLPLFRFVRLRIESVAEYLKCFANEKTNNCHFNWNFTFSIVRRKRRHHPKWVETIQTIWFLDSN